MDRFRQLVNALILFIVCFVSNIPQLALAAEEADTTEGLISGVWYWSIGDSDQLTAKASNYIAPDTANDEIPNGVLAFYRHPTSGLSGSSMSEIKLERKYQGISRLVQNINLSKIKTKKNQRSIELSFQTGSEEDESWTENSATIIPNQKTMHGESVLYVRRNGKALSYRYTWTAKKMLTAFSS